MLKFILTAFLFCAVSINRVSAQPCTPGNAIITANNPDSDGDGIADACDLDDDNDGIPDTEECSNTLGDMLAAYTLGTALELFPSDFGLALNEKNKDTIVDLSAKYGYPANSGVLVISLENASVHPTVDAWWTKDGEAPTVWNVSGSLSAFVSMSQNPEYYGGDSKTIHIYDSATVIPVTVPGLENQTPVAGVWDTVDHVVEKTLVNLEAPETFIINNGIWRFVNMNFGPKKFGFSTTTAYADPTYAVHIYLECDTDGDGIPNRLDLDSDNDGCLDALEGNEAFGYADIDDAGGTLSVGTGSIAVNQNLCADALCVDADGIPLVVSGGQNPVETYNSAVMSIACETALPITLISFNAVKQNNSALLNWATATEQNHKGFGIERSADGRTWEPIAFVSSLSQDGNSNVKLEYTYTDAQPVNGQNFYRLKQVDFDGKYEYSPVRMVSFDKGNNISIYPNPATDNVIIQGLQGDESIKIYDVTGRMVHQSKAENASVTIPLDKLSEGIYHISIISKDGNVSSHKVVKTK